MKVCCVIPARLNSSRFPNKLLQSLKGEKIIFKIINIAKNLNFVDKLVLATDSKELIEMCKDRIECLFIEEDLWCGSQRSFNVYKKYSDYDWFITIPSDEPMIDYIEVNKSWQVFLNRKKNKEEYIFTMGSEWSDIDFDRFYSSRSCKIVSKNENIMYFSRAVVPRLKNDDNPMKYSKKHLGIFIFSKYLFEKFQDKAWENYESSIAKIEGLEQTIFLENKFSIGLIEINHKYFGVDTKEDLEQLENL